MSPPGVVQGAPFGSVNETVMTRAADGLNASGLLTRGCESLGIYSTLSPSPLSNPRDHIPCLALERQHVVSPSLCRSRHAVHCRSAAESSTGQSMLLTFDIVG